VTVLVDQSSPNSDFMDHRNPPYGSEVEGLSDRQARQTWCIQKASVTYKGKVVPVL